VGSNSRHATEGKVPARLRRRGRLVVTSRTIALQLGCRNCFRYCSLTGCALAGMVPSSSAFTEPPLPGGGALTRSRGSANLSGDVHGSVCSARSVA
jgi:hypothetical protein